MKSRTNEHLIKLELPGSWFHFHYQPAIERFKIQLNNEEMLFINSFNGRVCESHGISNNFVWLIFDCMEDTVQFKLGFHLKTKQYCLN
jgi:hypothetical protein